MKGFRVVAADELRAHVRFEDLVEPVSKAFQASSARVAQNGLVAMFPGDSPASGDVYVKTGALKGCRVYTVKVSPWFAVNIERGEPQGGFIGVFDSRTGHTLALLDEQHYLSDIRTAAAGSLAARVLAPASVTTAAVLGAGVQASAAGAVSGASLRSTTDLGAKSRQRGEAQGAAQRRFAQS